jgi:hypothetical protein
MAAALVYLVIKRRLSLLGPDLLALLVMIVFGIVVLSSPSRDIRFDFPAIVALPFLTGILMSGKGQSVSRRSAALAAGLVFCGLLAAGVPTRHRAKIECLSRSYAVLAMATQCNAKSVLLATDSPTLNAYLLDLGRMYSESEVGRTGTLASNAMAGAPIELDYRVISEYDQVVFQDRPALSPPFTNQRVLEYERYVQSLGFSAIRVGNDIKVYSRFCRP